MANLVTPPVDIVNLANSIALTSTGEKIRLGHLWQKQTVIFIFLRHFACLACRAHVAQILKDEEKYTQSGSKLVFIGNGQPEYITKFQTELGLDKFVVLTDPTLESFRAAGFRRGFFYIVQTRSVVNAIKLTMKGHKQAAYSKDAGTHWQLGGIIAVAKDGKILYHYISEAFGDFPEEPHLDLIVKDENRLESGNTTLK